MELTFFDMTLAENSRLRNKQASTPAAVRKTVATTMGTRASIRLFCVGCWVVTVGGVSAVLVTFLVSSGADVVDSAAAPDVFGSADVFAADVFDSTDVFDSADVVVSADTVVGGGGDVGTAAAVVFCAGGVGRAVGTLFAGPDDGLGGGVILPGGGGCFCDGGKTGLGKPPPPLIGIDGGMGGLRLGLLPPPPGPSTFAHTCVLDVKCPSLIVTYR